MNEKISFTNYKDQEYENPTSVCGKKIVDKSNKIEENDNTITLDEFWKKNNMSNHVWGFEDL